MRQAIVDIVNVYKWSLKEIGKLYLDDFDIYGLYFWHEVAKEYIKAISKSGLNSL